MTPQTYRTICEQEAELVPDQSVRVRWTNCGIAYEAAARVVRVNAKSVRVRLTEAVQGSLGGYPAGREIVVPRLASLERWSVNNRVLPASERSQS